ncbi:MAG: GlcNAc-PI de-N-acetylase [Chloroflexi bacterium]|nr:PIG-L family deacetylase [Anaerolineaceae bacterium]NMB88284.1 GlcNAc-PI de-N-acetylase [Chloroflexota bacterium]
MTDAIPTPQNERPTLLAVLAHPDDETFGMGGTLALYAQRGYQVYLVCATHGEVGEMPAEYMQGYTSIAERREAELRCAAGTLGLTDVFFLDYRDSGMAGSPENHHPQALAAAPQEKVAAEVVEYIRRLRPEVVITFDPIGGYRHPDHIAIHEATVKAFHLSGQEGVEGTTLPPYQPSKLYFHVMPHTMLRVAVRLMQLFGRDPRRFGQNQDIDLVSVAEVSFPVHAVIDYRPVATVRDEASACHASQGGREMAKGVVGALRHLFASKESFMRAYPQVANGHVERDLFEGLAPV